MQSPVRFGILGPTEVRAEAGEPIPLGGPRPRAVLVMLLLDVGRVVSVAALIDGQYSDDPPAGAANAVQAQVSRLRRTLPAELIERHGDGYLLAADPDDVDSHRFERLQREGHRLITAGSHAGAAAVLQEAMQLWRGPALVDLPFGQARAVRLEDLRLSAIEDLVEAELALPEGTSVAELRELVAANPLRERLRGQLMRALQAAGRQAEALEEYDAARRLLAEELGADPSPELASVHLAILRAEQPAGPIRRGVAAQLTSFVGREDDLARLAAARDARLVTIVGPGGTGKTRLAVEFARQRPRETCFVDLSALDAGAQVPHAVLGALGLRESGFEPTATVDPTRRLCAALARQDLLVLLDNCEHVVAAVAALARTLLSECPALALLATSREALGLTGETLVPLSPLAVAAPDAPMSGAAVSAASTSPAVRLFADRAAAVRPGFGVGPDNVDAVIGICAALDGLPLAIELAAARMRQFTVEEVADRLTEHGRFRLLSRGDRTAAPRHRTLRAVVEWSWDLLGPDEQRLARRLAVFAGGAPLAAIEAVTGVTYADELLADLVDKSFVEFVETDGRRFRMLETIRSFCGEQLVAAGERDALLAAHARYHLDLAQRADPHLRRAEQLDWLALLAAEHANLQAALDWAVHADRETAFRMVAALATYWWFTGRHGQAGAAATELLRGEVPAGLDEEYVSCVLHAMPRPDPEHWARAAAVMRTLGRELRHPFGAALWGMTAEPPSTDIAAEAAQLLGTDPWNVALGRFSMVLLGVLGGRAVDGERELSEALRTFRDLGERWGSAQSLEWLAKLASWKGEWGRAHELWAEALDLKHELGALEECVEVRAVRAGCWIRQGDLDAAVADLDRAGELSVRAGQPELPVEVRIRRATIARIRGAADEAAVLLAGALTTAQAWRVAIVHTERGRLAEYRGDLGEAQRWHREAFAAASASPLTSELADAVEGLAGAVLMAGAAERAALLLGLAVALRGMAVAGDVDVARVAAGAGAAIGAEAFAAAYARGAAMTTADALTALDGATG